MKHVSIDSDNYFIMLGWKCVFAIQGEWVGLMELDERKVLKCCEMMLWVEKTSENGWEVKFSYLEKFSHSKNMDGMENLEKIKLNPLFSRKSQVNSHS